MTFSTKASQIRHSNTTHTTHVDQLATGSGVEREHEESALEVCVTCNL